MIHWLHTYWYGLVHTIFIYIIYRGHTARYLTTDYLHTFSLAHSFIRFDTVHMREQVCTIVDQKIYSVVQFAMYEKGRKLTEK